MKARKERLKAIMCSDDKYRMLNSDVRLMSSLRYEAQRKCAPVAHAGWQRISCRLAMRWLYPCCALDAHFVRTCYTLAVPLPRLFYTLVAHLHHISSGESVPK